MDRIKVERAIDGLTEWRKHVQTNSDIDRDISTAIEALKAQLFSEGTTSDMIDRQQAIDGKIVIQRTNGVEIYSDEAVPVGYLKSLPPAQSGLDSENLVRTIETGITATNSNDAYSLGMRNGMRWCKSLIDGAEPKFEDVTDSAELLSAPPEPQWIPVSERLPDEHESMFAKYYNTPKWNNSMWLKESDKMFVSAEVPGNEIIVDTAKMIDGKWFFGLSFVDKKVIAWMPLPTPYTK